MRVQILGPVRVWRDGSEVGLGALRQRAVFATLAAATGNPLTRAELIEALWNGRPPPSAANVIVTYVKNLRRLLEPHRPRRAVSTLLPSVGDGYALLVPVDGLDLLRFRRLTIDATRAQRAHDLARAGDLFTEALAVWQGPPFADLGLLAGQPTAVALAEERWAAVARYGDAMIAIGKAVEALPRLQEAARANPTDEPAQARLIRAYQAAGRQSDGFDTYDAVRRRLADELGVDPGPELVSAHTALLHGDRPPAAGSTEPVALGTDVPPPERQGRTVPAQLPIDLVPFVGRTDHLNQLDKHHGTAADARPTPVIVCISGAAGIGKTTLAAHWAHRVSEHFPDGRLFADLRGFDATHSAVDRADALTGFLEAIGVPPSRMPAAVDARIALYRTLMSGRRMLILLDNARDAGQVRPLLPASAGCLVVITSRDQLTGLVAAHGAHPVHLDLLSAGEARQLLESRLGPERVAAEPRAVADVIERCAGLPLALAVVAARAACHPDFSLAAIAAELTAGLAGFDSGDGATDLGAVLSTSYGVLSAPAQRMFRLLALHPGPDVSAAAAAGLAASPLRQARRHLAELTRTHLVDEHRPGRYAFHHLVRAYATELIDDEQRVADGARMDGPGC